MSNLSLSLDGGLVKQLHDVASRLSESVGSLDKEEQDIARRLNTAKKISVDPSDASLPKELEQLEERMGKWVEVVCALKTGRLEDLQKRLEECRANYFAANTQFGALKVRLKHLEEQLKQQIESQKANNEHMTPIKEKVRRCSQLLVQLTPTKDQPEFTDE